MPPKKDDPLRKGVAQVVKPAKKPRAKKEPTTNFDEQPNDLTQWKNDALKDRCRSYGIPVGGNKATLVQRIQDHEATLAADDEAEGKEVVEHDEPDGEPGQQPAGLEDQRPTPTNEEPARSPSNKKSPRPRPGSVGNVPKGKPLDWVEQQKRIWEKKHVQKPAGSDGEAEGEDRGTTKSLKENKDSIGGKTLPEERPTIGGKKQPVNGFRPQGGKGLLKEVPRRRATQREINRAREYREAIFELVAQVETDNDKEETIFDELIHHLGEAKKFVKEVMDAEVVGGSEKEPEELVEDQVSSPLPAGTQSRKRPSSSPQNEQEQPSKRTRSSSASKSCGGHEY